jgi:hypothetical protein
MPTIFSGVMDPYLPAKVGLVGTALRHIAAFRRRATFHRSGIRPWGGFQPDHRHGDAARNNRC